MVVEEELIIGGEAGTVVGVVVIEVVE